ncbi:hypothetical protein [Ruegeria arenilitoris]|uniref:hypothetical protein n=1 Tax=Ruegeria arenilitoris TaxID=1173585 RepID=UPI00158019FD|nr:hypothetical protein [Ruegeria arenilitoris]
MRINKVFEPHECGEMFPAFTENPALRRRNIFTYVDACDMVHMVDCCFKSDGLGNEVFYVSNDYMSVGITSGEEDGRIPTEAFLAQCFGTIRLF